MLLAPLSRILGDEMADTKAWDKSRILKLVFFDIPLVVITVVAVVMMLRGSGDEKLNCEKLPYVASKPVEMQCMGETFKLNAGDTLKLENNKLSVVASSHPEPKPIRDEPKSTLTDPDLDGVLDRGYVRVGVQDDSPPLNFETKNGKPTGLDYEIAKLIFAQAGLDLSGAATVRVEEKVDDYSNIPGLLSKKGKTGDYVVDIVMGGLTFSDEDSEGVAYSIPYLEDFGYSLISKGKDNINSLNDLRFKKVGVVEGDPDVLAYAQSVIPHGATIVELSDASDTWAPDAINKHKCDALIYDFPFAAVEVEDTNLKIKVAKLPHSDLGYKIGVRKGSSALLKRINDAIKTIKDLPEYASILKAYLPVSNVVAPKNIGDKRAYVVAKGDTLSKIAESELGASERWPEIQELNNIPNPHLISVGQNLYIP
ncbi:MAG: LysM peptidoglycan-binding domain-containing protein [Gammaproteobacteria bacterium]|nr:LysM peptidoglycan-binding domain-containing protein [Gammaproteobacteria bacterium]